MNEMTEVMCPLLVRNMVHTLLEIRILQGFFTNTYNKPLSKTPKGFFKNPKGVFTE
jgi:hypothetical protein